jgi:putative hydrolase of the HAD superfamily
MKYTHLFYDLDHTLWDFDKNSEEAMKDGFEQLGLNTFLGVDFDTFHPQYKEVNQVYWKRFRDGHVSREDLRWKRMQATFLTFKKYDEKLVMDLSDLYLEILPTKTHLFPHAKEILDYCQAKKYQMHLITNGFEGTQKRKLANTNLTNYFGEMISSERAMKSKPHAEIFNMAMNLTDAKAEQSIMIGDHFDVDIVGAQNVGMDQIYFNPNKRLQDGKATYEISCLSELFEIL